MFIENVYPSQINPDVEQIILKLWKVRNRIDLVYHLYLKVHTLWLYLLLIINPTRSVGHLQIHSFIYAQKLFSWENTSYSGPVSCKYPVSFRVHVFFFSLPWDFHLSTVFAICNAFNI